MEIAGFDWDKGNTGHCQKHGVTLEEIEFLFSNAPRVFPDPFAARYMHKKEVEHYEKG